MTCHDRRGKREMGKIKKTKKYDGKELMWKSRNG